jgi:hypothetical protein
MGSATMRVTHVEEARMRGDDHQQAGMWSYIAPDQLPAGLEQPLPDTREGPALNGDGQDEPTQQCRWCPVRGPRRVDSPVPRLPHRAESMPLSSLRNSFRSLGNLALRKGCGAWLTRRFDGDVAVA